ncbi:MAG TPA: hypothetical protein VMZ30_08170 [Pyrinomonadaceae bacterium]|nr:hypothetical protein [Pyrinomonadaceae bacterium]
MERSMAQSAELTCFSEFAGGSRVNFGLLRFQLLNSGQGHIETIQSGAVTA